MFTIILVTLISLLPLMKECLCDTDTNVVKRKQHAEMTAIASNITCDFFTMFENCVESSMPNQHFLTDDLQGFVNFPSKTTVGFSHKFTMNRKFFANMIQTTEFKEMLWKDEEALRKNMIKKIQFCDQAVMDQDVLSDFYDREVDPSKT